MQHFHYEVLGPLDIVGYALTDDGDQLLSGSACTVQGLRLFLEGLERKRKAAPPAINAAASEAWSVLARRAFISKEGT